MADDDPASFDGEAIMEGMALRPRAREDFDEAYRGTPPWDIGRAQRAFAALAESGGLRGRVLDVGCGTGEQALLAAARHLPVVGVDLSPLAIAEAEDKAREAGLDATFAVVDVCDEAGMARHGPFDTVLDCGLFHILGDDERPRFARALAAATAPGGHYYLLCFNEHVPGDWGPRRVTQNELRDSFREHWRVEGIQSSQIEIIPEPGEVPAWLAALTRL